MCIRDRLETWFTLQKHRKQTDKGSLFYHKQVKDILSHPYITALDKTDSERLHKKIEEAQYIQVPQTALLPENAPAYRNILFTGIDSAQELFASVRTLLE